MKAFNILKVGQITQVVQQVVPIYKYGEISETFFRDSPSISCSLKNRA
jgi:hypothetical protein